MELEIKDLKVGESYKHRHFLYTSESEIIDVYIEYISDDKSCILCQLVKNGVKRTCNIYANEGKFYDANYIGDITKNDCVLLTTKDGMFIYFFYEQIGNIIKVSTSKNFIDIVQYDIKDILSLIKQSKE